jgi:phage tail sheath protein FI
LLFESSGEALWARARQAVTAYLTNLWQLGALDGASPADAFDVRCDRTTMTQADIDAGRLIASVAVTAAQPVQRITITLALSSGSGAALAEAA